MGRAKSQRLRSEVDFGTVYDRGRSWSKPGAVLFVNPTDRAGIRAGFVAGRRVGTAVSRNRAKRLLREAYRQAMAGREATQGYDLILVARHKLLDLTWDEVLATVEGLLSRAGLFEPEAER